MEILNFPQGSDEWFQARLGSIGGSSIASVVAGGKGKMRKNLLYRLAGEILSGVKYDGYSNHHMERGIEQEAEARELYELVTGNVVKQVGLVKETDHTHYSPDGLIDPDGLLEIKCTIPSVHIETVISNKVPSEYLKQVQWGMTICDREWADFVSYSPLITDNPIFITRMEFNTKLHNELREGSDKFIRELKEIVEKIKK